MTDPGRPDVVLLDGRSLTPAALERIAVGASVEIDGGARGHAAASAAWSTTHAGHGSLRSKWRWLVGEDPPEDSRELVRAFVLGHCAGVGDPLPRPVVRALIATRANVLLGGATGCRTQWIDLFAGMLAHDVVPVVPAQGAVGAAGSAALAHIVRVVSRMGGEAWRDGVRHDAVTALRDLPWLYPTEDEALALTNGDSLSTALAALACARAETLLRTAEAATALSFESMRADLACISADAMRHKNHPGPIAVGGRMRERLAGSTLCHEGRRPDAFSVRCAPIVLGAARDAFDHVVTVVTRELNASSTNPLVIPGRDPVEAGDFHGAPVALAMDQLKVLLAQVASISERRTFRMTHGDLSGLPSFLVPSTGTNSGLMLAQYTAASLVSECKGLSHPASVDTIPTVQNREDHVPMSPIAAQGAMRILDALSDVLAIELLVGAQALDLRLEEGAGSPAPGTRAIHARVRERVAHWGTDRVLHDDLVAIGEAVRAGAFAGG
jgi:histidine ammonia-lyase